MNLNSDAVAAMASTRCHVASTPSRESTRPCDASSTQAQQITWILKLPMKGTINAIMDEEVECFPRELDLRIEARHLKKQRLYQKRHGSRHCHPRCGR